MPFAVVAMPWPPGSRVYNSIAKNGVMSQDELERLSLSPLLVHLQDQEVVEACIVLEIVLDIPAFDRQLGACEILAASYLIWMMDVDC